MPFESRPIEIKRYKSLIQYSISFDKHADFYKFYNSANTIKHFINLFGLSFVLSGKVQIKCIFSIVNFQPASTDGFVELTDIRVCSTNIYYCVYLMNT